MAPVNASNQGSEEDAARELGRAAAVDEFERLVEVDVVSGGEAFGDRERIDTEELLEPPRVDRVRGVAVAALEQLVHCLCAWRWGRVCVGDAPDDAERGDGRGRDEDA